MIKSVSIEHKFYDRCFSQNAISYGIVVGGLNKDEECVFLLISSIQNVRIKNFTLQNVDTKQLTLQCKQLSRMLPTGIHLSGVYFFGLDVVSKQSAQTIKQILSAVFEAESSRIQSEIIPDKFFLYIDSSKKLSAKAYSLDPTRNFFRTVEVKLRSVYNRWRAIKTHISLSLETHFPSERQQSKILEHLQSAVNPYTNAIMNNTHLLVNNQIKNEQEMLFTVNGNNEQKLPTSTSNTKARKRHTISKSTSKVVSDQQISNTDLLQNMWEPIDFTLFGPDFPWWQRSNSSSSIDSTSSLEPGSSLSTSPNNSVNNLLIHGRIPGIAYLPIDGTTVNDALQAFRTDLVRSINLRLELLSEELQVTSGQMEVPRMLLPQRILVRIPACPFLPLSEYKFISETSDDVVERIAMFCIPLGTTVHSKLQDGDHADSASSQTSDDWVDTGPELLDLEPIFNAACLDTHLEHPFEGTIEDELSDAEIIQDIKEIAETVSKSKNKIILFTGAFAALIIGILSTVYLDLIPR